MRYIAGPANIIADALSRSTLHSVNSSFIDFASLAAAQNDTELSELRNNPSVQLRDIPLLTGAIKIACDMSTGSPRPYVPPNFRRSIFDHFHSLSHPSIRATTKLITDRFLWTGMRKDIRSWARTCLQCQRCKVYRHTVTQPGRFTLPDSRFRHVHIDLVGPLPSSNGFSYILTCIDRFTRWPVATPIRDSLTETVAKAFLESWVSYFGTPATIITDRGSQFTSSLFRELRNLLGSDHFTTTAYHPASNGLVERFHRQLKAAIMTTASIQWTEQLPLILLGLRNTIKEDLGCSPADLVFGTTLRLPGEMVVDSRVTGEMDPASFSSRLKAFMRHLKPSDTRYTPRSSQMHKDLFTCPYVLCV